MKFGLFVCLFLFSLRFFGCGSTNYECPEGYSEQLIPTFGIRACLPSTWFGEEMKITNPSSGEEYTYFIFRQEPIPGKLQIGFGMYDFWGFGDDFEAFKEDEITSGEDIKNVTNEKSKNGTPYWMSELAYSIDSKEFMAQDYYFFPEGDYSRAFTMKALCLKEAFPAYQDTFQVVSNSFFY